MNYRNRALLDLAYELDCQVRLPGICTGGTGEPAHANWAQWGKGGAMKAHDFAFASSCRACHVAIDQGSKLTAEQREFYWLRGHVETMRQLWALGLIGVRAAPVDGPALAFAMTGPRATAKPHNRKSKCTRPAKMLPRDFGQNADPGDAQP